MPPPPPTPPTPPPLPYPPPPVLSSDLPPPPPPLPPNHSPPPQTHRRVKIRYRPPYMDESAVEDVSRYVPGGYHPVDIGDRIDEFIVLHKLGCGGFATVWLVQSLQNSRYYALKILCADVQDVDINERKVLERLGSHNQPNVIELVRSFEVTGPNGVHSCLVLPVCGPSLDDWAAKRTFTPAARHRIAEQVVRGVAFLHERGVAHADLTPSNVVFSLPQIQSMSPDALCQLLGPAETEKLKLRNGSYSAHGPKKIVKTPAFTGFNLSMTSAAVMIIDFGEAFFLDRPRPACDGCSGLGVPISFIPPEICFGHPPSAGSDTWELACLVSETLCARRLFPELFLIFEQLLALVAHHVGPLPHSWKGRFCVEKYGYWENGQMCSTPDGWQSWFTEQLPGTKRGTIRELITASHASSVSSSSEVAVSRLTGEQEDFLASLLRDMMVLEPEQRLSPRDTLHRLQSAAFLFDGDIAEQARPGFRPYIQDPNDPPPPSPPPEKYSDSESE